VDGLEHDENVARTFGTEVQVRVVVGFYQFALDAEPVLDARDGRFLVPAVGFYIAGRDVQALEVPRRIRATVIVNFLQIKITF
jgi:hypothetical protein